MNCWSYGCKREPIHAIRHLHLVGYQDTYNESNHDIVEFTKKVWAPCGKWYYGCDLHPLPEPLYFDFGDVCPHGITPEQRGIPVPSIPMVGKTAIVLETDL